MGLRDTAVNYLRSVFGRDRDEREKALSPSTEAEKHLPSSIFSVWGREDIGGLLSVSQNLMDRYADYESMDEYPDINCFAEGSLVTVTDGSMLKPIPIEQLACDESSPVILGYDIDKAKIIKVTGESPRLTGVSAPVIKIALSNGMSLRVTKDHKVLHVERGYVNAETLKTGDELVGMAAGYNPAQMGVLINNRSGVVKVTADPKPDGICRVFDVTTKTHNLIVSGVVCHNSANHYFANDATQPDIDTGRTIWVHSHNEALREAADVLLRKRLRMEDEIWSIAYTLNKYGNDFEELLVNENGVVGLNFLPVPTVRRIERGDGALVGFVQDVTGKFTEDAKNLRAYLAGKGQVPDHVAVFEDWQVCHMRLRSTHRRSPYGYASADGARWIWKRLILLEDAVLIYKLTRAPARFAFYIDVTDIPSDRVEQFLRRAKQELKKKPLVNPRTQRLDMHYNPLSMDEDFFLAVRDGKNLAKVDVLAGPNYQSTEEVEYFQRKLHGVLKVPRSYLGQDGPISGKSILSNEDVRAARVTLGIQRELRNGIARIIRIDQAARGLDPWKHEFDVHMTVPSGIYELAQMEVRNARADFAQRFMPFVSMEWIRKHVFKLSDEEMKQIEKQVDKEQQQQLEMQLKGQKGMMDVQMQAQQQMAGGAGGMPGAPAGPQPAMPAPMMGMTGSDLPRTQLDWKRHDATRRLEEKREKETNKRLDQLEDSYNTLLARDKVFAARVRNSQQLMDEIRDAGIVNRNGNVSSIPSGRRRDQ